MNVPAQHSRFGGSIAPRILRCPASVGLVEQVPQHLRGKSSSYAERGTALHLVMPRLIERECVLTDLVGATIGDYVITIDDVEASLRPVLTYVEALLDQPEAKYFAERRVDFSGVNGTFGTCDLIVRIGNTIHIPDYKFGQGVKVSAVYPDGEVNAQLLFYAASARHTLPTFFDGVDTITLTILQPVSIEPGAEMISSVAIGHAELDEFIVSYRAVCAEALGASPRLQSGSWCRFCPAELICPEHNKPLPDLVELFKTRVS